MFRNLFPRLVKSVRRLRTGNRPLAKRPSRPALEGLETRELLSCSAMIDLDAVLRVQCDDTRNILSVQHDDAMETTRFTGAIDDTFNDADFVALEVNFGTANDQIDVQSTAPDRPVYINNLGGADFWILGGSARVQGILSPVTISGAGGASTLMVNGSMDAEARYLTLMSFETEYGTYGYISGFPADIAYQFDAVQRLTVSTGDADDSVCVLDVGEGFETSLQTGGGNDAVHVAGYRERSTLNVVMGDGDDTARLGDFNNTLSPFLSPPSINGGNGVNSLHLVDSGRAEPVTYTFDNGFMTLQSESQGSTVVYFSNLDIVLYPAPEYDLQWLFIEYNLEVSADTPPECGCGFQGSPSPGDGFFTQLDGGPVVDSTILDALVGAARKSVQPATAWDLGLTL